MGNLFFLWFKSDTCSIYWSFVYIYMKDLYLVITLNLIFLLFHEIWQISLQSGRFHVKSSEFHFWNHLNQITQQKNFTFTVYMGGGGLCPMNSVKSGRFHTKDHFARDACFKVLMAKAIVGK